MADIDDDPRVHALIRAAYCVVKNHPDRTISHIDHRFKQWGINTSALLLEQLDALGWTLVRKEDDNK